MRPMAGGPTCDVASAHTPRLLSAQRFRCDRARDRRNRRGAVCGRVKGDAEARRKPRGEQSRTMKCKVG